jgi:hypothetical protein
MTRTRIVRALLQRLERGEYVVDERAVAEAMLASGVLVALETGDLAAMLVEDDDPGAARHVA